jgi:hypothetical protein
MYPARKVFFIFFLREIFMYSILVDGFRCGLSFKTEAEAKQYLADNKKVLYRTAEYNVRIIRN